MTTDQRGGRPQRLGWLASALTAAVLVATVILGPGPHPELRILGVCALLGALLLFAPPFLLLRRYGRVTKGGSYMDTTVVVDRGPYALVRHPQYLGYMLLAIGFALRSQTWITTGLAVGTVIVLWMYSQQEEAYCERMLGQAYRRYAKRVPGFNLPLGLVRYLRRRNPT